MAKSLVFAFAMAFLEAATAAPGLAAAAAAKAQSLEFHGNPIWLFGIGGILIVAFWLLIVGSLRSDRRDRGYGPNRRPGGGGHVYADIDETT